MDRQSCLNCGRPLLMKNMFICKTCQQFEKDLKENMELIRKKLLRK